MKLKAILTTAIVGMVACLLGAAAPAQAAPFAYVTNQTRASQRLPVRQSAPAGCWRRCPRPRSPPASRPDRGGGEPGRRERLRQRTPAVDSVSQYDVGAGGALAPKSPATVAAGRSTPSGVAVSPDGASVYVANVSQRQRLPVRRRRGRGAHAQEPGHGRRRRRPVRGGGEPGRRERLRRPTSADDSVSQYDVGAGGRAGAARARPRSPPAPTRSGWR